MYCGQTITRCFFNFKDSDLPSTGVHVTDWQEAFGDKISPKEVAIEIVEEEITWDILSVLRHIQNEYGGLSFKKQGAPQGEFRRDGVYYVSQRDLVRVNEE